MKHIKKTLATGLTLFALQSAYTQEMPKIESMTPEPTIHYVDVDNDGDLDGVSLAPSKYSHMTKLYVQEHINNSQNSYMRNFDVNLKNIQISQDKQQGFNIIGINKDGNKESKTYVLQNNTFEELNQ